MKISAIIPAYNETFSIRKVIDELSNTLSSCVEEYEIIVVDDGSIDDSAEIVKDQNIDTKIKTTKAIINKFELKL